MGQVFLDPDLMLILPHREFQPAITTWNRLEGRPRREDFSRSLRAEIRDPLWMLCRQWQIGEFTGDDSGAAVAAKVQVATSRINRFAPRGGRATGYDDRKLPMEAQVEREPLVLESMTRMGQEGLPVSLMTRAQMGRHWRRLLQAVGDYETAYVSQYGFVDPPIGEADAMLKSSPVAWSTLAALQGRAVDGWRLLTALNDLADEFRTWFGRVYSQPRSSPGASPAGETGASSWADDYLEYQFACSAPADEAGTTQTVLVAEQYHHGHLDWYSFDLVGRSDADLVDAEGEAIPSASLVVEPPLEFLPGPIEFGGMPNARWWEFEDRKTDLGRLNASTTDVSTMMLAEFGLIYANDWSLIPYELPTGSLCHVLGAVVTDVFGVKTLVRPLNDDQAAEQERWAMYRLSVATEAGARLGPHLFLPPATSAMLESAPLDRVIFARDEMANMVWGVEDIVPDMVHHGVKGYEAASDLQRYLLAQAPDVVAPDPNRVETGSLVRYRLGTTVPENWIPFIPVRAPKSDRQIRLQRAALPRLIPGVPADTLVEPRTAILRTGLDQDPQQPFYVNEEEVPQAGAIVTRTYQRTRWWGGQIFTWLGRRKQTGRGQGSSGLEFDRIVPTETDS
jgi:hypothetical protein